MGDLAGAPESIPDAGAAIFAADNEVGRELAKVDWAATPLGPPTSWPRALATAVKIMLSSRFSMWMAWGPQLTFFCNAAYRHTTLGSKYPWALGRPTSEVWAEIWADISPRVEQVLSTGQATWDEALLLILERSGYPEETYHTFSYSPLRDDTGQVAGLLCVVSEDTGRVIGDRQMATLRDLGSDPTVVRTEQQMLDFVVEQLGHNACDLPFSLIYLFGDDGSARLAGAAGIAAGQPAAPVLLSPNGPGVWPIQAAARGESTLVDLGAQELRLPTGAWPEPPAQALLMPLLQPASPPYGFLVAALNCYRQFDAPYRAFIELVTGHITAGISSARSYQAQQRRAEELAELDRAKTTFFANISHEFRTPLTLILGPVDELRHRASGVDEPARRELELVHRNALRLTKLVNTLLDFARIQAGRMQARFEPVDLSVVTTELASVFRSAIEQAGLRLVVDCPPLDEPVYVDRGMWEKVILNLLSNAVKYTFAGTISVRVARGGTAAVVTISDTGTGVVAAEMPRLFERFHRIEAAQARSSEGSGIGLALVKELIELHGGTIAADSTEGSGVTFTIRLPFGAAHLPADELVPSRNTTAASAIADPYVEEALSWLPTDTDSGASQTGETTATAGTTSPPHPKRSAQVLIADDNADMREYLTGLLHSAGYQVRAVRDGRQALTALSATIPDLLISDVMMPEMSGLELLAALRNDSRTATLPVLLLSARAGQEAAVEGLHAGADDYLAKPFAATELLARARTTIELARLRTHHARWRTALIDSLQDAFFVCDDQGAVVEINTAFTHILGYGPEDLPYLPIHPWWPDADTDPEAHRQVAEAFGGLLEHSHGDYTIPVTHRDGHRLWIRATFNHVDDPDTGRRAMVGTFRDVTAEHYAEQRQNALAALNQQLAGADTAADALTAAAGQLQQLWQARRVVAVTVPSSPAAAAGFGEPKLICAGEPARWDDLAPGQQQMITALRDTDPLTVDAAEPATTGVAVRHPQGVLVICVELPGERQSLGSDDRTLLTVLASRLGQGLHRVYQHDQQRETALALQHAILGPAQLPGGFAARYDPASRPLQVGGDWYDVIDLADGRIAMIVGDCVGHGLAAATVMGQLRSACRALLLARHSPSATLTDLDRFAAQLPGARCATIFCAILTPDTGELLYSGAGHPPPVLVRADGTTRLIDGALDLPLAVRPDLHRPEARVTLPPRATLLLYTDGLVERRRVSIDDGIDRAAGLLRDGRADALDDLADHLVSDLVPAGGYGDDVVVLLYRQPAPLEMHFNARVDNLADSRAALRSWLAKAGVQPDQAVNVLIAAGEAVANAIEHGHRDQPDGIVTLRATAVGDQLQVCVTDTGQWKQPQSKSDNGRGRGITLMRALMHDCIVHHGSTGTTVHLHTTII